MASSGRLSPSLQRPAVPPVARAAKAPTARQRIGSACNDDDMQRLGRKNTASGGFLVGMRKSKNSPKTSPKGPTPLPRAAPPRPRTSPTLSPSIFGTAERTTTMDQEDEDFMLPAAATGSPPARTSNLGSSSRAQQAGRAPSPPPVPDGPARSSATTDSLLNDEAGVGADETYGDDERALNNFLRVHSMLSMEATNRATLQLVSSMFEKASVQVADVPVIPFSYDASYLRPPNTRIGERQCACGDKCICLFMAKLRHGEDTDLAYVGTEFLLPTERETFLAGNGLPARRKKCLICTRYFQNLLYIQVCYARTTQTDARPAFPVHSD